MRWGEVVDTRWTVPVAATVTLLLRLPGLSRPIRPDEAGWFLVARHWDPNPDSVYGTYFVDRPPSLLAVVDLADRIGGPTALRLLAALAGAALVLITARVGAEVADRAAGRWSAVVVAALISSPLIDSVAASSELMALPLVGAAAWLALLAVRTGPPARGIGFAFGSGVAGAAALGMKQSIADGLVFAAALVVASWLWGPLGRRRAAVLAGALVAGVVLPVLLTVGWTLAAGVRLSELWYTLYGFRSDAAEVLADGSSSAPFERVGLLVVIALALGLAAVVGGFVVHFREHLGGNRPATVATGVLLAVELVALVAGGSYWRDYLFPLIPGIALCVAILVGRPGIPARRMRLVAAWAVVSAAASFVVWMVLELAGLISYTEYQTGEAVAEAARPGDTLTVFGGRADLQYASGLTSPYPYLWSLPMRTLDPQYAGLDALLSGPQAPTWLVAWVPVVSWDAPGAEDLQQAIDEHYVAHGRGCDDRPVYLLRGVERPALDADCD